MGSTWIPASSTTSGHDASRAVAASARPPEVVPSWVMPQPHRVPQLMPQSPVVRIVGHEASRSLPDVARHGTGRAENPWRSRPAAAWRNLAAPSRSWARSGTHQIPRCCKWWRAAFEHVDLARHISSGAGCLTHPRSNFMRTTRTTACGRRSSSAGRPVPRERPARATLSPPRRPSPADPRGSTAGPRVSQERASTRARRWRAERWLRLHRPAPPRTRRGR